MRSRLVAEQAADRELDLLWGVATSAYQAEGGYNTPEGPQTNWTWAEAAGDVEPLGAAAEFWQRHREDFARCRELGLNAFRLGIEWSRVQPTRSDRPAQPPRFDLAALDGYGRMLVACRDFGLEPVVTLHHFVHPAWLGADAWLDPATVPRFAEYVATAVTHVNRVLTAAGQRPLRYYLTINEPNMLVFNTYLTGLFPGRAQRGLTSATRAVGQLLSAHVVAYNLIHDIHREQGWGEPRVSLNNYCSDLYWSDKLLLDLLTLRERGVAAGAVVPYLRRRAREFGQALAQERIPLRRGLASAAGAVTKWLAHRIGHYRFDTEPLAPFLTCLEASPRSRVLDYLALDYYDPFLAHAFRFPVWWDRELAGQAPHLRLLDAVTSKWWDWQVLPRGMHFFCRHYAEDFGGRAVLIAENGMAQRRRKDNTASRRGDGMTRSRFLQLHVEEVIAMVREGVPLLGYLHWSLFDNYEWGTYTPRFGLFSLDYQRGTERHPVDHHGDPAAHTYAELVKAARALRRVPWRA